MGLSSLNRALHNARTAVGEPAHGVDNVGLFSVMCYVLYLKHDALAQELCGLFHVPLKVLTKCNVNVIHSCDIHVSVHSSRSQQLCWFLLHFSSGVDQMQRECHGSWHSQ